MQEETGLLISVAGPAGEVETRDGTSLRCHVRRNADPVITGDEVTYTRVDSETGVITGHLPRRSLLYRPDNGKKKLMAANTDCLVIVMSPPPVFSEDRIDRYLIAAAALGIPPLLLLNKTDLLDPAAAPAMNQRLEQYAAAGFPVCRSSAKAPGGLSALANALKDRRAVLTGLSGVGKSTLIRGLTGIANIRTGDVSDSGAGRHTTTVSRLYHLPEGGSLIDSPGIREFGLWKMSPETVAKGFPEFALFLGQCRFRDCRHLKEPGCALVAAAAKGDIPAERLASYQQIVCDLS